MTTLRVVITVEAEGDLESIVTYLGQESPTQAILTVERLERASLALGDAALRYPLVVNHEASGIRRRVAGSYNINYRVKAGPVEVVHILHAARDAERILFLDQ